MNLAYNNTPKDQVGKINDSLLISRDLSWLLFNYRVLEQAKSSTRSILERLKFLAITASNLDEFMMIRIGSLYNYLDFDKERQDYSGLNVHQFKNTIFDEIKTFTKNSDIYFKESLTPLFKENNFEILRFKDLSEDEKSKSKYYFSKTIYPMLTPMLYDSFHMFPSLTGKTLILGVETKTSKKNNINGIKTSFIQIPKNIPSFYQVQRDGMMVFIPIEDIIKEHVHKLYKKVSIESVNIFRLTRNGDFEYEEIDESDLTFVEEIRSKLKKRKTGRVVRIETNTNCSERFVKTLLDQFDLDEPNVLESTLIDYTRLWQIIKHPSLKKLNSRSKKPVAPLFHIKEINHDNIFSTLGKKDLVLHHPYNSIENVIQLLEASAEDKDVLAIKITIYRLAEDSRITTALQKAAENGKHVSVLFEVKARFDEENNIVEGRRLEKAGCFVVYGIPNVKTHTKLLMIVRKEKGDNIKRYVHMSSGNYNEDTAGLFTDISYLTSERIYGNDVSEFFNVITGHSYPDFYNKLITTPGDMRAKLIRHVKHEVENAKKGLTSGIIIKVNSLEDKEFIEELYNASSAGVPIKLIVRGICCCRSNRKGLSDNIQIKSIVGDNLEHSRIYYFHNEAKPIVYGGSADVMVRSFDKRIESLYQVEGDAMKMFMAILDYSLRDEKNSFIMQEDGSYASVEATTKVPFDIHKEFFTLNENEVEKVELF